MVHKPKTYKREVALGLLLFWVILGVTALVIPEATEVFNIATWPILGFAGGAFGLDASFKQGRFGA